MKTKFATFLCISVFVIHFNLIDAETNDELQNLRNSICAFCKLKDAELKHVPHDLPITVSQATLELNEAARNQSTQSQKMKEMIEYAIKMLSKGDCEADVHHLYWNKICTPNWITVLLTEEGNSEIFLPHPPHPPYHMTNSKSDIPPDMAPSLQNQAMSSEEFPKWPTTATQTNDDTTAQSNLQSAHLTGRDHEQASHILNKQYATPAQENRPSAAYVQPQPQVNPATATFSPVEHFVSQFHESSVPASPTSIPHESFQAQPAHQHRAPASVVPQEFLPPALQHY